MVPSQEYRLLADYLISLANVFIHDVPFTGRTELCYFTGKTMLQVRFCHPFLAIERIGIPRISFLGIAKVTE